MLALKYFVVHWGNGYRRLSDHLGVEPSRTIGLESYLQSDLS